MWLPLSIFFERPRAYFFENFIKFMFGKSKRVNLKFWVEILGSVFRSQAGTGSAVDDPGGGIDDPGGRYR